MGCRKKIGRKLRPGEVVHHKDRNKLNNSENNLHVFKNQKEHDAAHRYDAYRFGKKASYQGFNKHHSGNNDDYGGCSFNLLLFILLISLLYNLDYI